MSTSLNVEKLKLEAQIHELRQIISILNNRLQALEKALKSSGVEIVTLKVEPPIDVESRLLKWLCRRILDPHKEKHGIQYKLRFIAGTNLVQEIVLWIPQGKQEHLDEIKTCLKWVCKKAASAGC
ncbi:MAG: hypothetical protein NDF55_08795 [archaeon GB-1867-005]|nr:hypothetical protein [Candidatus Culexmicrobium cathedralense]